MNISEHFYQKMHSHVAFCVIYTRLGDIAEHETFLKARLEKSITVAGTQKLHAFYSIHGRHQLVVKRYSNSGESRTVNVVKV